MPAAPLHGAPTTLRLTAAQRRRLQELVAESATPPRVRRRALIVLLSAAGQSGEAIAVTLGVTRRTISTTRTHWRQEGFASLLDAPRAGRPPRADADYIARLLEVVERDPRTYGYAFTRWTAPRLAACLEATTGVRLAAATVSELLRRHGFVWRRTKPTIRNLQDERAIARARRTLRALKKRPPRAAPRSSFGMATG